MDASRVARPGVIVAAGWFALLVYAYPGRMTAESIELLRQARTKFFEPANPPAVSGLWRWLEILITGPMALLLVQSLAITVGGYSILRRVLPDVRAAWATVGLLLVPPITAQVATITPTSLMTGLLVAGTAGLVATAPRARVAGLVALFIATAVQPRALVATLPLLVMLFRWNLDATGPRRIVHALIAWVVISVAAIAATKHYTKAPTPLAVHLEPATNVRWTEVPRAELPPNALKLGLSTRTTAIQDGWTDAYVAIAEHIPLFSPWLFLGLALLVVPFALRDPVSLALAISAVSFQLTFRMSVWPIAAACLAAFLALVARRGTR